MGTVFKKTTTRPLPTDARVVERRRRATAKELRADPTSATKVESIATWFDRSGAKRSGVVVVGADGS